MDFKKQGTTTFLSIIFAIIFVFIVYSNAGDPIQAPTVTSASTVATSASADNQYKGPTYCLTCHPVEMGGWVNSTHARAFVDPKFQEEYTNLGSPPACLGCHTTAFNITESTFRFEGISCEQCHGPGNTMSLNLSVALCATCHVNPFPTYEEWLRSGPGHGNATCNFCHSPHPLGLRAENATATCARCHESHRDLWEQTKHGEFGVGCEKCHMFMRPADLEKNIPAITGHTFFMTPGQLDCTSCHNRTLFKHDVLGANSSACLSCHGEIHGLKLRLINGTVYPMDQPVALCAECHNERYVAWLRGTHGSAQQLYAPCTDCHNPHDPIIDDIPTIRPVQAREPAPQAPLPTLIALTVSVEILFFAAIIFRGRGHV